MVMSRDRYIAEGYRQLRDTSVYKRVPRSVCTDVIKEVSDILSRLQTKSVITEDMASYAEPSDSKPARFYLLPKVHKKGCPGRPVVSGSGSPTEGLSEIVDHFIQPLVPKVPSYIRDTSDFLVKLRALGPIPPGSILCTIDVTALYPSIPHTDGLANLETALKENSVPEETISGICEMTELVLKRNVFEFNSEFFIQTSGTAIGTKLAPSYANLFLSIFERNLLNQCAVKPSIWLRFIDDVFMIWTEGEDKLKEFLSYINTVHPAIQFTHEYSSQSVNFLDVSVTLEHDGSVTTDLYTKPTDTHQFLHMDSCHPNHTKKAIAFSQAIRILRICSDPATARTRCDELIEYLVRRGHGRRRTRQQVQRACDAYYNPQPRPVCDVKRTYFTVKFHPGLPDIKGTLNKYLPLLYTSDRMREVVKNPPLISFSQGNSLGNLLCRARLRNSSEDTEVTPSQQCDGRRCQLCPSFIASDKVISTSNGRTFTCRNQGTDCNTKWAVYLIKCGVCGKQYVGQSNNIRLRMNCHKSDYRKFLNGDTSKSGSSALYTHLKSHGVDIFKFQILEVLNTEGFIGKDVRLLDRLLDEKERHWIWKLNTLVPHGLNIDDTFFSQNRVRRQKHD